MEEITEMIPVVEKYIIKRTGLEITINPHQFNVPDMFLLGTRISQLNAAFVIAKAFFDGLENNQN